MGALTLGPLVLSLDRAYAGLGFLVLLLGAELWARRERSTVSAWAWRAAIAAFVGARVGFVVTYAADFASAPLSAFAFWQGGFAPWWGIAAAAVVTLFDAVRRPALRRAAPTLGAAALLAWWLPAALLTPAADAGTTVTVPPLVLEDLAGAPVALFEPGSPAIVNVWATWCPPCRRELPLLTATAAEAPDVRILLVNQREDADTVRAYLEQAGLPPAGMLLDRRGEVGEALRVAGLPTTLAFDGAGRLVDVHVGEISPAALRALVDRVR